MLRNFRIFYPFQNVITKHFALNDQEESRYGISTWSNWSNERAIREIYLEGFEGSIVEGDGMGVLAVLTAGNAFVRIKNKKKAAY